MCRKFCFNAFFSLSLSLLSCSSLSSCRSVHPLRCVSQCFVDGHCVPFQSICIRVIHRTIREKSLPISLAITCFPPASSHISLLFQSIPLTHSLAHVAIRCTVRHCCPVSRICDNVHTLLSRMLHKIARSIFLGIALSLSLARSLRLFFPSVTTAAAASI